jgi:hypothetical protein
MHLFEINFFKQVKKWFVFVSFCPSAYYSALQRARPAEVVEGHRPLDSTVDTLIVDRGLRVGRRSVLRATRAVAVVASVVFAEPVIDHFARAAVGLVRSDRIVVPAELCGVGLKALVATTAAHVCYRTTLGLTAEVGVRINLGPGVAGERTTGRREA